MRDEVVRPVRHRDRQPRAAAGPLSLDERREDLDDCAERARGEVRGLHRGKSRRRVLEHACPAQVVHVVPCALLVASAEPEPGDRAVHDPVRHVLGPDAEPGGDTWPEALEDDVGPRAQSPREIRVLLQVAGHGLDARAERVVPCRCRLAHRVAVRRLDAHDSCAQPQQFPARVRAGEIAREVHDERAGEGLHGSAAYLYPLAR
jgi:hypothetical protein